MRMILLKSNPSILRLDFSTAGMYGNSITYFFSPSYSPRSRFFYFTFGPQYNFLRRKNNKNIILGIYFDFGKETIRVFPESDLFGNLDWSKEVHFDFFFFRTGAHYSVFFKDKIGIGSELFLKFNMFDLSPRSSPELYYNYHRLNGFPCEGLVSLFTDGYVPYADLSLSFLYMYKVKRNIVALKFNFLHLVEGALASAGISFYHTMGYVKRRKK